MQIYFLFFVGGRFSWFKLRLAHGQPHVMIKFNITVISKNLKPLYVENLRIGFTRQDRGHDFRHTHEPLRSPFSNSITVRKLFQSVVSLDVAVSICERIKLKRETRIDDLTNIVISGHDWLVSLRS